MSALRAIAPARPDAVSVEPAWLRPAGVARPRPLAMTDRTSIDAARLAGLPHVGPERPVTHLAGLPLDPSDPRGAIVYVADPTWLDATFGASGATVVTTPALADHPFLADATRLIAPDPRAAYYAILQALIDADAFERVASFVHPAARVHPRAVVEPNAWIDADVVIGAGAWIGPNTVVGPGAVIKPNAVIGSDGFQVAGAGVGQRIVRHAGGVWIGAGASIGANSCVDAGLLGEFTVVADGAAIDNLCHIAHSVDVGEGAVIVATSLVGGSTVVGPGAWLGCGVEVNDGLRVGAFAYLGTGSVVVRDIPAHALAYGSPARPAGWMCTCRTKLAWSDGGWGCPACGTTFDLAAPTAASAASGSASAASGSASAASGSASE